MPLLKPERQLAEREEAIPAPLPPEEEELRNEHYTILYGDTGHSYESIFGKYLKRCTFVSIEDPYIRLMHQIQNLVRFCELALKMGSVKKIKLVTGFDNDAQRADIQEKFEMLEESLRTSGIEFTWTFSPVIHDREIKLDNGWVIKIGRGLDIYQRPENWYSLGSSDFDLRPCLETNVDIYKE